MNKLKPCPFCGGKPIFDNSLYADYIQIKCCNCGARSTLIQSDKKNSIESVKNSLIILWNNRII